MTYQQQQKYLRTFNKKFMWFSALSGDLLFWIAIDTMFLTYAKNMTASQILSLTSISTIFSIFIQIPILKIIKKTGNTNSVKLRCINDVNIKYNINSWK